MLEGCPRYCFGSEDSQDRDVLYVVPTIPDFDTARQWCRSPDENRNLIVLRDGVIVESFKGNADETNNALLATYAFHPQTLPLPITRPLPRIVPLKAARAIRVALSMMSRTTQRPLVKPALSSNNQAARVTALAGVDFAAVVVSEDAWKSIAFQLGQLLGLIGGQELYTKSAIAQAFPGLSGLLSRRPVQSADHAGIAAVRDALIEAMSVVYTRAEGSLNVFSYRSGTLTTWNQYALQCRGAVIDLNGERLLVRPYDKFFQLGEHDGWRMSDLAGRECDEIVEKIDGSLVSLFRHDGALRFATRGSLTGPLIDAAARLAGRYNLSVLDLDRWDHVFELVTPAGRFPDGFTSVRYDSEGLHLIGMRDRGTSELADYARIQATAEAAGLGHPRRFSGSFAEAVSQCARPGWQGAEGFIARFGEQRVKLKYPAYAQTSRVINALHRDPERLLRRYLRMNSKERAVYGDFLPPDIRPALDAVLAPVARGCAAVADAACEAVAALPDGDFRAKLAAIEVAIASPYRGVVIRCLKAQAFAEAAHRALAWTVQHDSERLSEDWSAIRITA
ncbi:MAG: hypothetical protein ACI8RZ_004722 [Myxococcota bacterium]|jgi:hypothetical protein